MAKTVFIPHNVMKSVFSGILLKEGYPEKKADAIAEIFTVNSLEGVYTHGVNRFPRFVRNTRDGYIKQDAEPTLIHTSGSLEQWNGNLGPGTLNAVFATNRAIEIAEKSGIGLVALGNTNHWMRAGYYGGMAAKRGFVFIGCTNAIANMSAWGAKDQHLGNNPFVLAAPFGEEAIILDFAMSLYSYGKMELYANEGKKLPYPGGFDTEGVLTDDPAKILDSWRPLPIGYWKGAGLSLLIDILATILSGGSPVCEITSRKVEYAVSQVFIAIDISKLHNTSSIKETVQKIIDDLHSSIPEKEGTKIRYPGENLGRIRNEALNKGIPVAENIWEEILGL
jgi:3-dehydro-L-gulonate 2-dehydrogenase